MNALRTGHAADVHQGYARQINQNALSRNRSTGISRQVNAQLHSLHCSWVLQSKGYQLQSGGGAARPPQSQADWLEPQGEGKAASPTAAASDRHVRDSEKARDMLLQCAVGPSLLPLVLRQPCSPSQRDPFFLLHWSPSRYRLHFSVASVKIQEESTRRAVQRGAPGQGRAAGRWQPIAATLLQVKGRPPQRKRTLQGSCQVTPRGTPPSPAACGCRT